MSSRPIKSASRDFTKEPFHLVQENGNDKRYVVYLKDKIRIRTLLSGFINQANNEVQVKIRDLDNQEKPIDYSGSLNKSALHKIMTEYEEVIFHNGYHDLMIRNPNTSDYIVFDEHGLIFIYTDKDYGQILMNLEAHHGPNEKLIYEFDHWHYCLSNGREQLTEMIKKLGLIQE